MIYGVTTWNIPDSIGNTVRKKAMAWARKITKCVDDMWPEKEVQLLQ